MLAQTCAMCLFSFGRPPLGIGVCFQLSSRKRSYFKNGKASNTYESPQGKRRHLEHIANAERSWVTRIGQRNESCKDRTHYWEDVGLKVSWENNEIGTSWELSASTSRELANEPLVDSS